VRQRIRVALLIDDLFDTCVDEHFKADTAGQGGAEQDTAINANAMKGSLNNDILFGMETSAQLMPLSRGDILLVADAANILAVGKTGGNTVIAGCQNPFILYHYRSDVASDTG